MTEVIIFTLNAIFMVVKTSVAFLVRLKYFDGALVFFNFFL